MGNSRFRNKCLSMLIVFALLFAVSMPVFATGDVEINTVFTVGTATADAGVNGVEIPILVKDCEPFVALGLSFVYDDTALTLVDIVKSSGLAGTLVKNVVTDKILNFDWDEAAFEDGEIFILKFDVSPYAQTGVYPIKAEISRNGWNNNENDDLIPKGFVDGSITVTGLNVAQVGDEEYEAIGDALAAAIDLEQPATVTMLANAVIADESDRIVIPDGADITFDLNGHTITSSLPSGRDSKDKPIASAGCSVVEVKAGGQLNLVNSSEGGGFVHASGDPATLFLANAGTLDMNNIAVSNFCYGISDISTLGGTGYGTYGTIRDCTFNMTSSDSVAFNLKAGEANAIEGVEIYGAKRAITVGDTGKIDLLKDCIIVGNIDGSTLVYVGTGGEITQIKDCTMELDEYGNAIELSHGRIVTIDGGSYITQGYTIYSYFGYIGTISSGYFEGKNTAIHNQDATIGEISGGVFKCVGSYSEAVIQNEYPEARIGTISGGKFYGGPGPALSNNYAEIGTISGGEFYADNHYTFYLRGGTVEEISGGLFYNSTYTALRLSCSSYKHDVNLEFPALIKSISGGTFISDDGSAVYSDGFIGKGHTIEEITGGTFIGKDGYGLGLKGGKVEHISGGVFDGKLGAIGFYYGPYSEKVGYDEKWNYVYENFNYTTIIEDISGGYYRGPQAAPLILIPAADEDSKWICEDGYGFATVPLRPEDLPTGFPDEEIIEDPIGFYHFGQTADITWTVEGKDEVTDKFVIGDPVYYAYGEPTKEGGEGVDFRFKGWQAGGAGPALIDLPNAVTGGAAYAAAFEQIGSEEDYLVYLSTGAENVNAGEEFTVDIFVSSGGNDSFYGATVVIAYDEDIVEFDSANTSYNGFGPYATGNTDTTRGISGARQDGYTLTGGGYKIASIGFRAKSDIGSGKTAAIFSIAGNPIVDQQMVYDSIEVDKGEDITVNLYNLTVTFTAGDKITMEDVTAYVKYDEEGLYTGNDYADALEEPEPEVEDYYSFKGWKLGDDYFSFADIKEMAFTENTTFTATATPGEYTIGLPGCVNIVSGVEEGQIVHGADVVFTVTAAAGYKVDKVTYTAGEGDSEEIDLAEGKYIIPGYKITDDITIAVTQLIDGGIEFISGEAFNSLPAGHKLLLLTVAGKLSGSAYEYSGDSMFYSGEYSKDGEQVYLYVVPNEVTEEEAREAIQIKEGATCAELQYDGDINFDERLNSSDATVLFALYQGFWESKSFPTTAKKDMQTRLEADMDGNKTVDSTDAQKVLYKFWGWGDE